MKSHSVSLLALATAAMVFTGEILVQAQDASASRPPGVQGRRAIIPGTESASDVQLKQNYRIHLTISVSGDKKRECSVLTSSRQVKSSLFAGEVSDNPDKSATTLTPGLRVSLSGLLDETDEGVRFQYSLQTSIPTPNTLQNSDKGTVITSMSYTEEGSTSALLMKPGKSYEVLKSGSRTYTLRIEAVKDDQ